MMFFFGFLAGIVFVVILFLVAAWGYSICKWGYSIGKEEEDF